MEFTLLGTSSGLPTIKRNVSATVLSAANSKAGYLVDCGEATQHQMLRCRYAPRNLMAIFITHMHGDHVFGLFGLIASMAMSGRTQPLNIYGPTGLQEMVETVLRLSDSYVADFPLHYHVTAPGEIYTDARFRVEAIALSHRVPSFAYQFTQQPQSRLKVDELRASGLPTKDFGRIQKGHNVTHEGRTWLANDYLQALPTQSVIVGGDNDTPSLLHEHALRANVLVHEATFTELISEKIGPSPMHSTGLKVGQLAAATALDNVVLTHFSARYADVGDNAKLTVQDIEDEARTAYSGRLFLARDFDRYRLDRHGVLHCEHMDAAQ